MSSLDSSALMAHVVNLLSLVLALGRAEAFDTALFQKCKTRISHNTDNAKRKAKPRGQKLRCDLDVEEIVIWNFVAGERYVNSLKTIDTFKQKPSWFVSACQSYLSRLNLRQRN